MELKRLKDDRYLLVLLVLAAVFVTYWVSFANYRYATFSSEYYDVGVEAYSFYWHVHGLNYYTNLLDYVVFTNHLSIFSLFIVPVFALFQKPVTFFLLQDIFLAATSILVYFTVEELLNSRKIGFAMAFAFLINPATSGLTLFDFHLEAIVVFFFVLSFYFYMKEKRAYFMISYILLLSLYDVEPFVGASLLLALLIYEVIYRYKSKTTENIGYKKRLNMLIIGFGLTLLFAILYSQSAIYITKSYSNTPYSSIVPIQRLKNYVSEQFSVLNGSSTFNYNTTLIAVGAILGLLIFFFGFGASSLANPVISLILYAPWLMEVLVIHNVAFTHPYTQYYSFALGGSFVSAILGYMMMAKGKFIILNFNKTNFKKFENKMFALILIFSIIIALFDLLPINHLLSLNYAPNLNYTQINVALKSIPSNANVMAQLYIAPHLFYIHNLELPPVDEPPWFEPAGVKVYWFKPDYIVVDKYLSGYNELINSSTFNIFNYTKENYTLYYNQSGLSIYRRIS